MQHTASDVKVYKTFDYRLFSRKKGNRAINQNKVKKIVRDIRHGVNLLPDFPILVSENGKLDVIDGQHRLEAAVQTKEPIYYIIRRQDMELHTVARFNSLQEKWKPADFINCYIEKGLSDYKKLEGFIGQYGVPVSVALNLLYYGITGRDNGGAGRDITEMFKRGEFVCKHYRQARDIMEQCRAFEAFSGWNTRPFIVAISKILEADLCDFTELADKFNKEPRALERSSSAKAYLVNLEQIYNKGYHKRRNIY